MTLLTLEELDGWEHDTRADDAADAPSADDLFVIRAIAEIRMWRKAVEELKVAVDELRESRRLYSIDPGDSFDSTSGGA